MIVAMHQPNYLPWPGFFHKMLRADVMVLSDEDQFNRKSFTQRTLIRRHIGSADAQWLTIPIKRHFSDAAICDLECDGFDWWAEHWRAIQTIYGKAPHWDDLKALKLSAEYIRSKLVFSELTSSLVLVVAAALGITTPVLTASNLGILGSGCDKIAATVATLGGDVYLSGIGAKAYHRAEPFDAAGVAVQWQPGSLIDQAYEQHQGPQRMGLSIIDTIANLGFHGTRKWLGSLDG